MMIISNVSKEKYEQLIKTDSVVFNKSNFCELNKSKVDNVEYLIISKVMCKVGGGDEGEKMSNRFAISIGIINNITKTPFSAPYSIPTQLKRNLSIKDYDDALEALDEYAINKKYDSIQFILPPLFYNEHSISAWINAMLRHNYKIKYLDLNYSLDLKKYYTNDFINLLPHKARSPFRIALKSNLSLKKCVNNSDIKIAYDIIVENHTNKGFPVKMTYNEVIDTIKIIKHDVFIVYNQDIPIASAIIYYSNNNTVQIIYWGNRSGYNYLKPMHYLVYQLIQYYGKAEVNYIDIGPSTENSIPNYGLCDFKESIGCTRSLKFTMQKNFK